MSVLMMTGIPMEPVGTGIRKREAGDGGDSAGGIRYIWGPAIDHRAAQWSELTLDLLNWSRIRGDLVESLDRCRVERSREEDLLRFMEERYRMAAETRDRCEESLTELRSTIGGEPQATAEARRSHGRLAAEASLAYLELITYRNRTYRLRDRIDLIESRLAELDAEIARGRARMIALGGSDAAMEAGPEVGPLPVDSRCDA